MNIFRLVPRYMRRNLRRTLLTALTMALATFIYTVLVSVPASMDRLIRDASTTLRLIVSNRTAPWYDLPARYCEQVREMPGAVACAAITGWPAIYQDPRDVILTYAVTPGLSEVFPDYDLSRRTMTAFLKERRGASVGLVLMRKYHWQLGQQIILHSADARRIDIPFVIVGEIPSRHYPNAFVFRRDYFNEVLKAHGYGDSDIAWNLVVRADSADHVGSLSKEIDENFRNSDYETRTMTESDALASGLSSVGDIRAIVFGLCTIVVFTVLLVAANSTAMMVRERVTDVAVMRVLGFNRAQLARLLFSECGLIGLFGGALGAGAALWIFAGGVTLGAVVNGSGALWVGASQALQALAVAVGVGILSGVIPILSMLRVTPALALREVV
jgi:putative ABC transport system permease protein